MPRKKGNPLHVQVRFKVPKHRHPEKLAQQIRAAVDTDSELPHLKMAKINWAHPQAADASWKSGTKEDLLAMLETVGVPNDATVSTEQVGSHVERVPRERTTKRYVYRRRDGRFASQRYIDRYPQRVRKSWFDYEQVYYEDFDVPDYEIVVDFDTTSGE